MISDSGHIAWVHHAANVVLGAAFEFPVSPITQNQRQNFRRVPNEPALIGGTFDCDNKGFVSSSRSSYLFTSRES
jgi:hypothetical protein